MKTEPNNRSRRHFLEAGAAVVAASGIGAIAAAKTAADPAPHQLNNPSVTLLADALNRIGRDARRLSMSHEIKAQSFPGDTLFGPAVTTQWRSGLGGMTKEDVRRFMFEPLDRAASGSVWVVAGGSSQLFSLFGDIIALALKRNAMAGAVTDNGCRDVATMREISFAVFARATVPFGPGDQLRPVAANEPVECGGVPVRPGDWVAADLDGVIVVPQEDLEQVRQTVVELQAKEQQVRSKIRGGAALVDAYHI